MITKAKYFLFLISYLHAGLCSSSARVLVFGRLEKLTFYIS